MRLSDRICQEARALIAGRLGLDFPEQRRADLERGLLRACRTSSISAPDAYLAWLVTLPNESPEWRRLAGHLTVGETYFFRDRPTFEALEQRVLPDLIAARRSAGILRFRFWSAGCATGEEPYSLAILLDRLLPDSSDWALTILATDINPEALEAAQRGRYRQWSLRDTPPWIPDRYFRSRGVGTFELDPRIRQMVTFALLNLAEDVYPDVVTNTGAMDLILCRNVLMYFTPQAQRQTVRRLERSLMPGGWLVVSAAEGSSELLRPLVTVNLPDAILYRKEPASGMGEIPRWQPEIALSDLSKPPSFLPPLAHPVLFEQPVVVSEEEVPTMPASDTQVEALQAPSVDLREARAMADQGDLEQAREACQAALARDRLDPEAYLLLAAIDQERGEIAAALEHLRRTIYLAPGLAPAHFLLGSLLLRQGKRTPGRRSMETVVRLLSSVPRDELVPGSDGLTAGRLLETARAYLEWR